MTELEWLASADPLRMLESLGDKASDRKQRLFACACCRRIWHLLSKPGRHAVEVSERYADERASSDELRTARAAVIQATLGTWGPAYAASCAVSLTCSESMRSHGTMLAGNVANRAAEAIASETAELAHDAAEVVSEPGRERVHSGAEEPKTVPRYAETLEQKRLLEDIVGSLPFRRVTVNPDWLASLDQSVLELAQAMYGKRTFDRMALLASALEDGGCGDNIILRHCRLPGVHVRGCWVVDLVLGMI